MTESIERFGETLRRYQAAVDDFDRTVAAALGVNPTDARCLEVLAFDHPDGATPAQLGAALGLTSGSVTTMVDRLAHAGLVTRAAHPSDGRKVVVVLTADALERAIGLHRSLVERGEKLLRRYSTKQLATMIDFFERATALQRDEEAALRASLG